MLRRFSSLLLILCLLCGPCAMAEAASGAAEPAAIVCLGKGDPAPDVPPSGWLEAHFLNMGAADTILLRCGGETILVDCGHLERADRVLDTLAALGIEKIDYAFITHPHNDHIGGFIRVLDEVPVGIVLMPDGYGGFSSRLWDQLLGVIEANHLPVLTIGDGTSLSLGSATLTFYQWIDARAGTNDRSMILRAQLGGRSLLLAADVENNGQKALAAMHGDALSCDILKMPHHGLAAYTLPFHEAALPGLAIITNAKNGILEATLNSLRYREVPYLLTTDGTLAAATDGVAWTVWRPGVANGK